MHCGVNPQLTDLHSHAHVWSPFCMVTERMRSVRLGFLHRVAARRQVPLPLGLIHLDETLQGEMEIVNFSSESEPLRWYWEFSFSLKEVLFSSSVSECCCADVSANTLHLLVPTFFRLVPLFSVLLCFYCFIFRRE